MKSPIFFRQNSLLKLIYVIFTIVLTVITDISFSLFLFAFHFFWFLVLQNSIIRKWLITIIKLLPFYSSFLFFSLIFDLLFIPQIFILIRISFILLLSVFILETSSIASFTTDTAGWEKYRFTSDLRFFLIAVIHFIPELISIFKQSNKKKLSLDFLAELFQQSYFSIKKIDLSVKLAGAEQISKFAILPNLVLILSMLLHIIFMQIYRDVLCVI